MKYKFVSLNLLHNIYLNIKESIWSLILVWQHLIKDSIIK